jgi:hypothetical protein
MRRVWSLFVLCAVSICIGCGSDAVEFPDRAQVTGKVTLDGDPVAGADVVFVSTLEKGGHSATGRTNADGEYTLSSFGHEDGAVLGDYAVTVTKDPSAVTKQQDEDDAGDDTSTFGNEDTPEPGDNDRNSTFVAKNVLPPQYASSVETSLLVKVEAGSNDIPLELEPE